MRRFNFRNPLTPLGWFLLVEFILVVVIWNLVF